MNQIIALKILNIEFDFDGEDMSLDEQQQLTRRVIGSKISVVNDEPDQTLEELACDYISDQEGWCIYDIEVEELATQKVSDALSWEVDSR